MQNKTFYNLKKKEVDSYILSQVIDENVIFCK